MAIRQSNIQELRYLKRKNLEQEAKILGNMYRDQIHAQGIDCLYYKRDKTLMHIYKNVVDENNILFNAYGYDNAPSYSLSTEMLVHMDVDNDIFNLNKFGIVPNMDVTFTFDAIDFACALAPKFGRYREYKLSTEDVYYQTDPGFPIHFQQTICQNVGFTTVSAEVSGLLDDLTPGMHEAYCHVVGKGFAQTDFPVNDDIYASFLHHIMQENDLITCFKLVYRVSNDDVEKYEVTGKVDGAVLFYDIASLDKYHRLLHPDVGDVVSIDFPDGRSREQYEITEATDKHLTNDGINAFLHKYVWRCKARRYINTHEDIEPNEANSELEEQMKYDAAVQEELAKKISVYPDNEDDVYGGYENNNAADYDKQKADISHSSQPQVPVDMLELVMQFQSGSKLATDGYDLWFIKADGDAVQLSLNEVKSARDLKVAEQDLQWLKANDQYVVFNSLDGKSFLLALDELAKPDEQQICLDSLFDLTASDGKPENASGQCFYKFKSCRTLLFATADKLFCHLPAGKTYKLA